MGTSRRIEVEGRLLAYEEYGSPEGDPVCLLHGAGTNRSIWQPVAEVISARHHVIALDLPGHNESGGPPARTIPELTNLVRSWQTALGIEHPVLIGHSMGGAVALAYVARYGADLRAVGLVSTAANFELPVEVVDRWCADEQAYLDEELGGLVAPGASPEVIDRLNAIRKTNRHETRAADLRACLVWDAGGAGPITLPTLLMTAEHDLPVIRTQMQSWHAAFPDSQLIDVPDAGHMMLVEQPQRSAAAIGSWVGEVTGSDTTRGS